MFKNKNNQVRAGWLIVIALLFVFIGQGIFMFPGLTLYSIMGITNGNATIPSDFATMGPAMILLTQGMGTVGGIAATLVVFRAINKKYPNQLGLKGKGKDFIFGLFLGALSITMIFIILLMTNQLSLLTRITDPQFSWYTLSFLILFILVGFFEEMFFRGYVMQTLASRGNKKWVIYIVSATVFSLVHISNPNVSLLGLLNIVLVGLLFAYMFEQTNSLLLPIGYHITWNFFQGNVFGFPVSGTTPYGLYQIDVTNGNALLTGGTFGIEGGLLATLFILLSFLVTRFYVAKQPQLSPTVI